MTTETPQQQPEPAPASSPDALGAAPVRGPGVRRLNRVPLYFAFGLACVILAAVAYTHQARLAEQNRRAAEKAPPQPPDVNSLLRNTPDGGFIAADKQPEPPLAPPPPPVPPAPQPALAPEPPDPAWEQYRQRLAQRQQLRDQAALAAVLAPATVPGFGQSQQGSMRAAAAEGEGEDSRALSPSRARQPAWPGGYRDRDSGGYNELTGEGDLNRAEAKRRFLSEDAEPKGTQAHYLAAGREPPRSPYEVKAGTVIPSVMIGGVNSDLPGQLLAQVSEHVYDTATGRFILIPQGSRLIGTYDNGITTGQERVLVAWTRIIYPDASSIDLGRMPGADEGGYAGFKDKVDEHFWKVFGSAIMMSLFTGGMQLSQGQGNGSGNNGLNAQQVMTAALGQQMGQLGMQIAQRNLRIQPTIEIRPGYRFVVEVTRDMIIRPWRGARRPVEAAP
jgi:type IV secretion system protein TrbI